MCITLYLKKAFRVLRDKEERQYGWKVFRLGLGGEFVGEYCGCKTVRPQGKWLKSKDFIPSANQMPYASTIHDYEPGWHVFRRKIDAKKWCGNRGGVVVRVLVREVRERGFATTLDDSRLDCFIADEIFIPK